MQRLKVQYRPEAIADLDDIYNLIYRLSFSPETAEALVGRILARCGRIGHAPNGGRLRDDLELGLRTVPFERKAVIACRVEFDCVRIINVFYGGRDFEALYRGQPETDDDASKVSGRRDGFRDDRVMRRRNATSPRPAAG